MCARHSANSLIKIRVEAAPKTDCGGRDETFNSAHMASGIGSESFQ